MEFKNINSRAAAFEYADKIGGVPRVPFSIFWEFYPEDEIKISEVARQVQEVFNMVQSTEPFKIEMVEKIEDDIFNIMIEPGGLIPFKVGQNSFGQRRTARKIDEQLDAYRKKKKEQKAPSEEEQKAPEKRRKSSNELHEEFKKREEKIREEKIREEKILAEIRAESLAKAEAEVAKTLAKAKAEVEALTKVKAEVEALVNTLAEAKAEAKAAKEAKVETEAKAEAEVETKAKAKATTLKLFGYTVFEYSK